MKNAKNKRAAKKRAVAVQLSEKDLVAVVGGALRLPMIGKLASLN
jgi:hypothetical protein